jgi:hypothetical protein
MRARAFAPPRTIAVVKVTREQAELLKPIVGRHQRFANKLVDRLTRRGYAMDDPLFRAAVQAKASLQDLASAIHYESCAGGVGSPATPMNYPPPVIGATRDS